MAEYARIKIVRSKDMIVGQEHENSMLEDAKNYGPGPAWLPGQVVEVSGAVLYTIMLEDGRSVRRHVEQLRSRTNTGQKRVREIFDSQ